jgi:hypothetical protein
MFTVTKGYSVVVYLLLITKGYSSSSVYIALNMERIIMVISCYYYYSFDGLVSAQRFIIIFIYYEET